MSQRQCLDEPMFERLTTKDDEGMRPQILRIEFKSKIGASKLIAF
jgi:hypothetical protein